MRPLQELSFGYTDAENYRNREKKSLFNRLFIRTNDLNTLMEENKYFLIGEKGTGKTALAVYLSNNTYGNCKSSLNFIRETEYQKFITLKKENNLDLSDYSDIWRIIILLLLAKKIEDSEKDSVLFSSFSRFAPLKQAVEEFYKKAFSPEILYAINFIADSKRAAKILSTYFSLNGSEGKSESFSESRFQINLLFIKRKFESAIKSLRLEFNHILFIDGIDIRPTNIDFENYLECIKGLANAIWTLNSDFFSNIKDSKGRIKVVLLLRPDIFSTLGLQNLNNKINDNSILLDWKTSYANYRSSDIFKVTDNMLNSQQSDPLEHGKCWDYYFPYRTKGQRGWEDSFISFLRFSTCKPRDIIFMISKMHYFFKKDLTRKWPIFNESDFRNTEFEITYSDYFLGEIKDYLGFYHSDHDYELFLKFFEFLDGRTKFNYDQFMDSYEKFADYIEKNKIDTPIFFETSDSFLQFLFEINVIAYIEDTPDNDAFIHWCYRERSYANLNPKVKLGVEYRVHYGLIKVFKLGKQLRTRAINRTRNIFKQ